VTATFSNRYSGLMEYS